MTFADVILKQLESDDLLADLMTVSTPSGWRAALQLSPQVHLLSDALNAGAIDEETVMEYVKNRLATAFVAGELFSYDIPFAAIAIAFESRSSFLADEYLNDLAALKLCEFSMSSQVARDCLRIRTQNQSKEICLAESSRIQKLGTSVLRLPEETDGIPLNVEHSQKLLEFV